MYRAVLASFTLVALLLLASSAPVFTKGKDKDFDKGKDDKGPSATQKPKPVTPAPIVQPEPTPGDAEIVFLNGSKVRMTILTEKLEIVTIYGKLTVPVEDVQSIEFGVHYPEGVGEKIDDAIKNLGNTDYREREKAMKVLMDLGPYSYASVVKAARSRAPLEVTKRAKEIVQKLQTKLPKKDQKTSADDKVVTPTHTIVGRIVTKSVKTKADYFGEIEHQLANMRTLRAVGAPGIEVDLTVDAAKYANAGEWLDTGYQVDSRYGLVITAKGLVDTWPQGPGSYMSGPAGTQGGRKFLPNGQQIVITGGQKVIGPITGQTYGSILIAKIGEDGEPFIVADRYDATPAAEGKLYLTIGPSQWNCNSTGQYEVKIARKSN